METLKAIQHRRSIRAFQNKPIPDDLLEQVLKAGIYAPTARNTQSWKFVVVQKRARLDALALIHPYGKMLKTATAAILVCGDTSLEPELSYQIQNCSAATQNLLLAAFDLGLGAVWLGIQPRKDRIDKMIRFCSLPESIVPVSLIALGFPDVRPKQPDRSLKGKVYYEEWKTKT